MKLLSICIPTYNRVQFLPETLESIIREWDEDVEITIADNASTDGTSELVRFYQQKHERIRYFRWDQNMGADRNYLKSVEIATGKYCWILGSDDTIAASSIEHIKKIISLKEPQIVLFNRMLCTKEMKSMKEDRFIDVGGLESKIYAFEEYGTFEDYLHNSRSICATFSYLSSMVFEKEAWDATPTIEEFIGSAYVHAQKLLGVCDRGGSLVYLNRALVNCRLGNDTFRDLGLARRVLLDLDGYNLLAEKCFGSSKPECARALRAVLLHEYPFGRILRYQGVLGKQPEWDAIVKILRDSYNYPRTALAVALFFGRSRPIVNLSFFLRDFLIRWPNVFYTGGNT